MSCAKKSFLHAARSARVHALASSIAVTAGVSNETQLFGREVLLEAVRVLALIIRNAIGCLLCAWIANLCFSQGNIFSSRPSRTQSTASLVVASLVWTNVMYAAIVLLTQAAVLAPMRFVVRPDGPAGFVFCLKRLARASFHYYLASLALTIGFGALLANVTPPGLRWLKLEFYVGNWVNHGYTAAILYLTRQVYRAETRKGQERQQLEPLRSRGGGLWRSYLNTAPQALSSVLAGMYVHVASQSRIYDDALAVLLFAGASFGVKIVVQELVKVYVMRRGVRQIRLMCMLLGVPTVLIDTQVRVMLLLGKQSSHFNALGSVTMAAVELGMRVGKMVLLLHQVQRRKRAIEETDAELSSSRCSSENSSQNDRESVRDETATSLTTFERWRKQMADFHTAEVMADMYAEYIAIGCSASILYFFCDHPKYIYVSTSDVVAASNTTEAPSSTSSGSSSSTSSSSSSVNALLRTQFQLVGFQVLMEIAVDYVCCVFEISMGARFRSVRRFGSFLGFVFMTVAVVNIAISSLLFLK
ncbi:hypothetical protein PybrP1_003802 [[Pythium] brassicae (nom. inval.)]|nr:hypothetical protein PybrP1_003802 [[Pythium] brassicae (nom. inval.)]